MFSLLAKCSKNLQCPKTFHALTGLRDFAPSNYNFRVWLLTAALLAAGEQVGGPMCLIDILRPSFTHQPSRCDGWQQRESSACSAAGPQAQGRIVSAIGCRGGAKLGNFERGLAHHVPSPGIFAPKHESRKIAYCRDVKKSSPSFSNQSCQAVAGRSQNRPGQKTSTINF